MTELQWLDCNMKRCIFVKKQLKMLEWKPCNYNLGRWRETFHFSKSTLRMFWVKFKILATRKCFEKNGNILVPPCLIVSLYASNWKRVRSQGAIVEISLLKANALNWQLEVLWCDAFCFKMFLY